MSERYIEVCGSLFSPEEYEKLKGEKKEIKKLKLYSPYPECEDRRFEDIENKINEIIDYIKGEDK